MGGQGSLGVFMLYMELHSCQGVCMGTKTTAKGQMSIVTGLKCSEGYCLERWEEGTSAEAMRWFYCNLSSMLMLIKWPLPKHFQRPWYSVIVGGFSARWCPLPQKLAQQWFEQLCGALNKIFTSSRDMIITTWFSLNRKSVFSQNSTEFIIYSLKEISIKQQYSNFMGKNVYCTLHTQPEQSETLTILNSYIIFWGNKEKCHCKHFS